MALSVTVPALDCVPVCAVLTELDDAQFFAILIDRLVTETGISLSQITGPNLVTAVETARCSLQQYGPQLPKASPETLKAIALYLSQGL